MLKGTFTGLPKVTIQKPQHECGIFGVYFPGEDVSRLTFYGLYALQHRGQESVGIAVSKNVKIKSHKKMGFVREFFDQDITRLKGDIAIGHTRYSNTGGSSLINAQPAIYESIAIAENGNLINPEPLRNKLAKLGYNPSYDKNGKCSSDGELIAQAIHSQNGDGVVAKIKNAAAGDLKGAYSLTILADNALIGVKDPLGFWPLCLGRLNNKGYVLASESCALDVIGAKYIRELEPGEIISIDEKGTRSHFLPNIPKRQSARCLFDINYFLRPDSLLASGRRVYEIREKLGQVLALKNQVPADVVFEIPNSGQFGAIGYAQASGIPLEVGFIKNSYIGRTFINPDQRIRQLGVKLKLNPIPQVIVGKKIILVDDSIVRGTSSRQITQQLFKIGAKEVHWRLTFPQVTNPCSFGIDIGSNEELISAFKTPKQVAKELGATSVAFNTLADFLEAVGLNPKTACTGCTTGVYPMDLPDRKRDKFALEAIK